MVKKIIIILIIYLSFLFIISCGSSSSGSNSNDPDPEDPNIPSTTYGESGILYVSISGNDSNLGTKEKPFQTIQKAVDICSSENLNEIHVSEGIYNVNGEHSIMDDTLGGVNIRKDLSLFGGYSEDWSQRNPEVYKTIIQDITTNDSGNYFYPNRAVYFGESITDATCIDGFIINGGAGEYNTAILCDKSSPIIQNNYLYGGSGSGSWNFGIRVLEGSPVIEQNTIHGGDGPVYTSAVITRFSSVIIYNNNIICGGGTTEVIGVDEYYSSSLIANNIIYNIASTDGIAAITLTGSSSYIINNVIKTSGHNALTTSGIRNDTSQIENIMFYIYNNTIDGGDGTLNARGIYLNDGNAYIENNIIFLTGGSAMSSVGISEEFLDSDPITVQNNNIFNCITALYQDRDYSLSERYMISVLNGTFINNNNNDAMINPVGVDNLNINPNLDPSTFGLTTSTPASIRTGGKDLSTIFTIDINGNERTVPWSIGAYEMD